MEPVEITAGRLHLRPWQAGDEDVLLAAEADDHIARWSYGLPEPRGRQDAAAYVRERGPARWTSGEELAWAVCDSADGRVLADLALHRIGPVTWSTSFWCLPAERGRGVLSDALACAVRFAFSSLGAKRIEWQAEVGNWASRRVAEKAGFRFEGVRRHCFGGPDGSRVDGWVAARLPQDSGADTAAFPRYEAVSDGSVTLRRWRLSDAADVARACSDEQIARWLPVPVPYDEQVALAFVDGIVPTEWFDGTVANVAVTDTVSGAVLGAVGLTVRDKVGEVGYWTAPWARGRGVAVRAARLHAAWGLQALGMSRIELLTDVRNLASQRVAEKAGFTREGVARAVRPVPRGTDRVDMTVFALLPTDLPLSR